MVYDVIVVGGGPAGVTAAIYAKRSGLRVLLIERGVVGGTILTASKLENYPGFLSIPGTEFGERLREQLQRLDVEVFSGEVIHLDLKGKEKGVTIHDTSFKTKTVVLASGTEHKRLNIKGVKEFTGKGVSFCATCDAPFFRDKTVAVVGGGNSAVSDALFLCGSASRVYLIHRGSVLRAEEIRQKRLKEEGVGVIVDTEVTEVNGDRFVESITLRSRKDNTSSEFDVDGVFIAIGQIPSTLVVREAGVGVDEKHFIVVDKEQRTSIPGVFAAGDVTGGLKQVTTAVGEGAIAAMSAYTFIKRPYWV